MAIPIRWFYVAEGRRQGPVELSRLVELILSGTIPEDTLVWYAGRPDWIPASRIAEIAHELPPPLPTAEPAPPAVSLTELPAERVVEGAGAIEGSPPAIPSAAEGQAAGGSGARPEQHHRHHRHKRHRYVVIASPWWKRWIVPFILALIGLGLFLWLYLMHVNQPAAPPEYPGPATGLARSQPPRA
ncbi:MAG TPA: DUF4339 domain-containing protein [Vicinamibacteria bacterium]|nr:DUF4339 domain-containing protein [Vicinamibacteria bacterium]